MEAILRGGDTRSLNEVDPRIVQKFSEEYGHSAYTCRYRFCVQALHGFATTSQREYHEHIHKPRLRCPISDCEFHIFGFTTPQSLEKHRLQYHTSRDQQFDQSIPFLRRKFNTALREKFHRQADEDQHDGSGTLDPGVSPTNDDSMVFKPSSDPDMSKIEDREFETSDSHTKAMLEATTKVKLPAHAPASPGYATPYGGAMPYGSATPYWEGFGSQKSPNYSPINYSPKSPNFSPQSPKYSPTNPNYSPKSPKYSPTTPVYQGGVSPIHSLGSYNSFNPGANEGAKSLDYSFPIYSPTSPRSPRFSPASLRALPESASAPPTSHNSLDALRPKRNVKKRTYGDSSFEGYGEGYVDDDMQEMGYSTGDGEDRGGGRKRPKKVCYLLHLKQVMADTDETAQSNFQQGPMRQNSYGPGMVGA